MYERFGLFIGGGWTAAGNGATAPVFSPVSEQPMGDCPVASEADTAAAIAAAERGFKAWASTPAFTRADSLHRIAEVHSIRITFSVWIPRALSNRTK